MESVFVELLKESPIAIALIISMYLFLRAMQARDKCLQTLLDALQKAVTRLECMVEKLSKKVED